MQNMLQATYSLKGRHGADTEWGIMGRRAARWSRTERNGRRLCFQFSLLPSKLKWRPTLSSTNWRKSPWPSIRRRKRNKRWRKNDFLLIYYITTGNGRFLSQAFASIMIWWWIPSCRSWTWKVILTDRRNMWHLVKQEPREINICGGVRTEEHQQKWMSALFYKVSEEHQFLY